MGFDEFMDYVAQRHEWGRPIAENLAEGALGLTSESGEVAQIVRKYNFERQGFNPGEFILELGDVCHYLAYMCRVTGLTLDDLIAVNTAKGRATDRGIKKTFEAAMRHWDGRVDTLSRTIKQASGVIRTCSICKYYQPEYKRCGLTYNDMDPATPECHFYDKRGEHNGQETD